jgi:hypothetical protein
LDYLKIRISQGHRVAALEVAGTLVRNGDRTEELRRKIVAIGTGHQWRSSETFPGSGSFERAAIDLLGHFDAGVIDPGSMFADHVIESLRSLAVPTRQQVNRLLTYAATAGLASKPTQKWVDEGRKLGDELPDDFCRQLLTDWFGKVEKPGPDLLRFQWQRNKAKMSDLTSDTLRGLVWIASSHTNTEMVRGIRALALRCYEKIPEIGAFSAKAGNACVWALGRMSDSNRDAVSHLVQLKAKVKYSEAIRLIDKAIQETGARLGIPADVLVEIGVPSFGLDSDGTYTEEFGDCSATVSIKRGSTSVTWAKTGKHVSSVPSSVKTAFPNELKTLKATVKELVATIQAHTFRIESMFLNPRTMAIANLRERYLEHGLIGTIARRLIWSVGNDLDGWRTAIWRDGILVDVEGHLIHESIDISLDGSENSENSENFENPLLARLWHPLMSTTDEIVAWRRYIETNEITQPFKQAHREVYVLTDAEQTTGNYSNRFAAHVVRRHQLAALCKERGWKMDLWDTGDPVSKTLPSGLAVQFHHRTMYGPELNGIYTHATTGQVVFVLPTGVAAELADVEPITFSETLRDVDLLLGVTSIGIDATWIDHGPDANYWVIYQSELTESSVVRREVLESLVPKLDIRDCLSLTNNSLIVRGKRAEYMIHLRSGNVLIPHNSQYLCIVEGWKAKTQPLVLPFEGDHLLSIILSKAMLLAADDKITDPSILRQLDRGMRLDE